MKNLAHKLVDFLENVFSARLSRGTVGRIQPIFVGPPLEALTEVFNLLTRPDGKDWNIAGLPVVVLLVDGYAVTPKRTGTGLSQRCNWDYAVSIRNSVQMTITLVVPSALDSRPDSIANTMETIGNPRGAYQKTDFYNSDPWPFLISAIARGINVPEGIIRQVLSLVSKDTRDIEVGQREAIPWIIADQLLGYVIAADLVRYAGLPSLGRRPLSTENIGDSYKVLNEFKNLCSKVGLQGAEQLLRTGAEQNTELNYLIRPLQELFIHLRKSSWDGITFARCPTWYFRPSTEISSWWKELTYENLRKLLNEVGETPPSERLRLSCTNALNAHDLMDDEILIVQDTLLLQVRDSAGGVPSQVEISRRIGRRGATRLENVTDGTLADTEVPSHDNPLVYKAESVGYRPATIKVVSLSSFSCHGHARIQDAVSNPLPSGKRDGSFEQEITVARTGTHSLVVHGSSDSACISIRPLDNPSVSSETNPASFQLDIEDGDEVLVTIHGLGGQELGKWTLHMVVQEPMEDAPRTRLEALVRANQENKNRLRSVRAVDSYVRRIEDAYLTSPCSWRGVLGCWSSNQTTFKNVDWDSGILGDIPVTSDVRPGVGVANPPSSYLSCRENVRQELSKSRRTIGELTLTEPGLITLIENYLKEYIDWVSCQPEIAAWTDLIALHAPSRNIEAGQETPTSEPVALLLSPLHPLRLAWHCNAQRVLDEARVTKRCPAAGLLNAHASPSIMALPIYQGEAQVSWRAFFAVGCNEPHWALLWNKEYLGNSAEKTILLATLEWLGFMPTGLTGGFTLSQAKRSLEEVSDILPARAVLRVGLVGRAQESGCVNGLIDWSRDTFSSAEEGGMVKGLPASCEVYDLRDNPPSPSATTLASLSEDTDERTRWFFKGTSPQVEKIDLVIMDQIGTTEPRGIPSSPRSPLAPGVLFRLNIRQDIGDAQTLRESRIGRQEGDYNGLNGELIKATISFESLATNDNDVSHFQFRPNQHAIGQRLEKSSFVAATSSQIDPACFIRGARSQDAYLWDYELPGTMGFDEDRAGYYLVAKPAQSMKDAIVATTQLVTSTPPPVESLLDEISKRGIPVLKRMASGGSHARGELGVMLAVRLLQDAFREIGTGVRLPVASNNLLNMLLPVDSYWEPLSQFRRVLDPGSTEERPDLLVFSIIIPENGAVKIKVTPLEVKFREGTLSNIEVGQALRQAANLGNLLQLLWAHPLENDLWMTCATGLLAQCLDQSFRVYADSRIHGIAESKWTEIHEKVIHDVLGRQALITINKAGRLLAFDASSDTAILDMDGDGRPDTAIISQSDAEFLLAGTGNLSAKGQSAIKLLDLSFPSREEHAREGEPGVRVLTPALPVQPPEEPTGETSTAEEAENLGEELPSTGEQGITSPVPPQIRQRVREAFDGFIGNEPAVKRVTNDLLRALIEQPPYLSKNYLFTGQPSTGKTELARRMARALALPFVRLDGRGAGSRERLFELVNGEIEQQGLHVSQIGQQAGLPVMEYPPLVVFIDEVHLVPRGVQESLLTMLEAADRTVTLTNRVAVMNRTTFLFATTRASDLDAAFRSRCSEVQLKEYELGEVAEMLERKFPRGWSREIYMEIAKFGRRVPRVAIELARELETEIAVSEHPERGMREHLEEVRKARELDKLGLTHLDLQYLAVLESENRPIGEQTILNLIGTVDRERVIDEIEPFLRRLSFIRLGPRGREITSEGREYLLSNRRNAGLD